jgi:N-acetyl-anhydromuramyl-L-alanine amidase AmpD
MFSHGRLFACLPVRPTLERRRRKGAWVLPVWIADALRAEGVDVVEYRGWRTRGHGDFADIRGVMVHHTGADRASAASIAEGRPDLQGPLSQLHVARDGTVTVVAAGVAWHAGAGRYPWLPTNAANRHTIGIECANSGTSPIAAHRENWPDAQYFALVRCCAAIHRRLGLPATRTIGHREYAGRAQGKWDPGAIDMDVLRADVRRRLGESPTPDVLARGSSGPFVAALQRRLKHAYRAYAGGLAIDGDFGPATEAAVREFQRRTPGLEVDGIVGPETAGALRLNAAPSNQPSPQ